MFVLEVHSACRRSSEIECQWDKNGESIVTMFALAESKTAVTEQLFHHVSSQWRNAQVQHRQLTQRQRHHHWQPGFCYESPTAGVGMLQENIELYNKANKTCESPNHYICLNRHDSGTLRIRNQPQQSRKRTPNTTETTISVFTRLSLTESHFIVCSFWCFRFSYRLRCFILFSYCFR